MFRHHGKHRRLLIIVLTSLAILVALAACGQKSALSKKTKVSFHFAKGPENGLDQDIHSWGAAPPDVPDDVDCVGVFVDYPEQSGDGTCRTGSHGTVTANDLLGLYTRGGTASAELVSGAGRVFSLIGFHSTGGCSDLHTIDHVAEALLSAPVFLAQTLADLIHDEQTVSFSASLADRDSLTECSGGPFAWASDLGLYGSGRDVGGTISSSTATFSGLTGAAITRINGISASGRSLTVASSSGFHVGDEVLWQVIGTGSDGHGCDSLAPVVSRPAGLMGITILTEVTDLTHVTLADHIVGHGSVSLSLRLSDTAYANSADWCKMQLVRIPQLDNLTITGAGVLSADALDLTSLSAYNGIVVMKVNGTLTLDGATINASGMGYGGPFAAGYAGVSMYGRPNPPHQSDLNGSGGAGDSTYGGGGGASSYGTSVAGSPSSGGAAVGGSTQECLDSIDTICAQMGGGGGGGVASDTTNYLGAGGGVILIWARSVAIPATSVIRSNGKTGTSGGGGGGGGGWMKLYFGSISGAGALTASVSGGTGGSGGPYGGGGNGGTLILHSCSASTTPITSVIMGSKGDPSSDGSDGNDGDDSDISTSTCPE